MGHIAVASKVYIEGKATWETSSERLHYVETQEHVDK
jgi:hypothetical protein